MSSVLKQTMAAEFQAVAEREGDPDLISKIADETICTDPMELLAYLEGSRPPGADDGSDLLIKETGGRQARPSAPASPRRHPWPKHSWFAT